MQGHGKVLIDPNPNTSVIDDCHYVTGRTEGNTEERDFSIMAEILGRAVHFHLCFKVSFCLGHCADLH